MLWLYPEMAKLLQEHNKSEMLKLQSQLQIDTYRVVVEAEEVLLTLRDGEGEVDGGDDHTAGGGCETGNFLKVSCKKLSSLDALRVCFLKCRRFKYVLAVFKSFGVMVCWMPLRRSMSLIPF